MPGRLVPHTGTHVRGSLAHVRATFWSGESLFDQRLVCVAAGMIVARIEEGLGAVFVTPALIHLLAPDRVMHITSFMPQKRWPNEPNYGQRIR